MFCRRRWRRIQHIVNEFWSRWRKEYLLTLQGRSKWSGEQRNIQIGDVVLVKDDNVNRNQWELGIVKNFIPSNDNKGQNCYTRAINKLVVIIEKEFPNEEPNCI